MKNIGARTIAFVLVFCCVGVTLGYAGDETTIKGMITARSADTLTVKTADGTTQQVTLTDSTKVQSPKGLGVRKQQMSWTSLIPGLKVNVKGTPGADGKLAATVVSFSKDDLQTASMIQAGLTPTEEKVATNQQNIAANQENIAVNQANISANKGQIASNQEAVSKRFSELADYDVKDQVVVYFDSGKATVSPADQQKLTQLAQGANKLSGFIIEVAGYADSTGNAAMNEKLSRDRAYNVINFLMQNCNVPPRHIVAPGAMGMSNPTASNETSSGRKENRRVEVKVMVNKGVSPGE